MLPNVRRAQRMAEALMVDACTVQRPTGTTTDPLTGLDATTYALIYGPTVAPYYGKCAVQPPATQPARAESVGSEVTVQSEVLKIPVGAPALFPGDLATFASDTTTVRLRNLKARVDSIHVGTYTAAQRVPIQILPGVA